MTRPIISFPGSFLSSAPPVLGVACAPAADVVPKPMVPTRGAVLPVPTALVTGAGSPILLVNMVVGACWLGWTTPVVPGSKVASPVTGFVLAIVADGSTGSALETRIVGTATVGWETLVVAAKMDDASAGMLVAVER